MSNILRTRLAPSIWAVTFCAVAAGVHAQQNESISGRVSLLYAGQRPARDVGQAVVWLETDRPIATTPDTVQIIMAGKAFHPQVVVVSLGSTVTFPNNDGFDHNVFSHSGTAQFNLGFYGPGSSRSHIFTNSGIVRVYCNVHARMTAFVVVRDNPYFTQPSGDGSFLLTNVPSGRYVLHAWHERAGERAEAIEVPSGGLENYEIMLDARRLSDVRFRSTYSHPYATRGRRY